MQLGGDEIELIVDVLGLNDVKAWLAIFFLFNLNKTMGKIAVNIIEAKVVIMNLDKTIEETTDAIIENNRLRRNQKNANNSKF